MKDYSLKLVLFNPSTPPRCSSLPLPHLWSHTPFEVRFLQGNLVFPSLPLRRFQVKRPLFFIPSLDGTSMKPATSHGGSTLRVCLPSRRFSAHSTLESIFQLSTPLGFTLQSLLPHKGRVMVSHHSSAPALSITVSPRPPGAPATSSLCEAHLHLQGYSPQRKTCPALVGFAPLRFSLHPAISKASPF